MAEGGGLLNRCTVKSRTGGSNPPLSAIIPIRLLINHLCIFSALHWMPSKNQSKNKNADVAEVRFVPCRFLP